jgi:PIN domain nuclease of toxin-antitoxin system
MFRLPLTPPVAEWGATATNPEDFSFVPIQERLSLLAIADDLPAAHGDRLCVRRADQQWAALQ